MPAAAGGERDRDGGAVTVLLAGVIGGAVALAMGVVSLAEFAVVRAETQTAADAAALAGAVEGRPGAQRIAAANGVDLITYDDRGDRVRVVVGRGMVSATAAASRFGG
ncbi:MAG: helicase/secretion neighborhood TadE-like protein [Acidimicrobiales bacterium]